MNRFSFKQAMGHEDRNFRSLYYEKVGCKSVEEKKSLEILFKDKILDRNKIQQFCSRFSVPFVYRNYVWKILLGVLPVHKTCHEFVTKQKTSQYNDLLNGLKVLQFVTADSPKEQMFLQMWLLENYSLVYDRETQIKTEAHQNLLSITRTMIEAFDSDVDAYWIAKGFYEYIKTWSAAIPYLVETAKGLLMKEDIALFNHLQKTDLLNKIPMESWFGRCFSGVLHDTALIKVWDKMLGGSYRVLIFVCLVMLTTMRRVLLTCINLTQFISCVQSVTDETADVIVSRSLEMWQVHGRSIPPSPLKNPRPAAITHRLRSNYNP